MYKNRALRHAFGLPTVARAMAPRTSSVKTTTSQSCSLLFNNCTANRTHVAYIHHNTVILVPEANVLSGTSSLNSLTTLVEPNEALIHQVRWAPLSTGELLIVASARSIQIYTADGGSLLHVVTAGSEGEVSYRGIASCATSSAEYICVGCSNGAICLIPLTPGVGHTFTDALLSPVRHSPAFHLAARGRDERDSLACSADSLACRLTRFSTAPCPAPPSGSPCPSRLARLLTAPATSRYVQASAYDIVDLTAGPAPHNDASRSAALLLAPPMHGAIAYMHLPCEQRPPPLRCLLDAPLRTPRMQGTGVLVRW